MLYSRVSLEAQMIKNLPAMWETWVRSLGWEDPLEKGQATYSNILETQCVVFCYNGPDKLKWCICLKQRLY